VLRGCALFLVVLTTLAFRVSSLHREDMSFAAGRKGHPIIGANPSEAISLTPLREASVSGALLSSSSLRPCPEGKE
jgi:hypothetical protein